MVLDIQQLVKSFDGVKAVNGVSLSLNKSNIASIIGPNGAGKTTLFNLIGGFLQQDTGSIFYKGMCIDRISPSQRAILGIGRLWQDIRVFKKMTVMENLLVAKKDHPGEKIINCLLRPRVVFQTERIIRDAAENIINIIKLEHKRNSLAQDLSFGQQKLLALGRLLINDSELLLIDEPTAGIHPSMIDEILDVIKNLSNEGKTVLIIEHNLSIAKTISDVVFSMIRGKIEPTILPSNVLT